MIIDGYLYAKIRKGMYVLPQARRIAHDRLVQHLKNMTSHPWHTAVPWKHCYTPITFTLVVGDFGVKYTDERHADHLHRALTIFTASPPTEMGRNISTSYSNGTTMNVPLTSVCPMMTRKPCTSYNIPPLPDPKTPHTLGFPHNMDALVNNHHAMT